MDCCLLKQCNKQIADYETEMLDISRTIATMKDTSELNNEKLRISDVVLNLGLKINKFLSYPKEAATTPAREGIRLPKIAVSHIRWWSIEVDEFLGRVRDICYSFVSFNGLMNLIRPEKLTKL